MEKAKILSNRILEIGRMLVEKLSADEEGIAECEESKVLIADVLDETEKANCFLPYEQLVTGLKLDDYEKLLLCLLWYLEADGQEMPIWSQVKRLLRPYEKQRKKEALSVCFWHCGRQVQLSPVTRAFLLGEMPVLADGIRLELPIYEKRYDEADRLRVGNRMLDMLNSWEMQPAALVLSGEEGSGRHFVAQQLAVDHDYALLTVEGSFWKKDAMSDATSVNRLWNDMILCSELYHALICLEIEEVTQEHLVKYLSTCVPFVLMVHDKRVPLHKDFGYSLNEQKLELPKVEIKEEILNDFLSKREPAVSLPEGVVPRMLISKQLPMGSYIRYINNIRVEIMAESFDKERNVFRSDSVNLTLLPAERKLEELMLPEQQYEQFTKICSIISAGKQVREYWGYDKKYSYGNGISVLFYGAPGTGKTMAAQVLANTVGMPIFRVDLSQLISKYIGETQKNIGRIFAEAQKCDCILFFDEADALFAKRSEVSDAQDRYSNAETAYLLQCIEQFDGVSVLATNLLQNFDEAFRRRITYMLHFPLPDEMLRLQLWQSVIPKEAEVSDDVDYVMLARMFEMSGAAIKNASFHGACCAWSQKENITMQHLLDGIKNEYLKTGKALSEEQRQLMGLWNL